MREKKGEGARDRLNLIISKGIRVFLPCSFREVISLNLRKKGEDRDGGKSNLSNLADLAEKGIEGEGPKRELPLDNRMKQHNGGNR